MKPAIPAPKWIWHKGYNFAYNSMLEFRREFSVSPAQRETLLKGRTTPTLKITADAAYRVWINDRILGQGPAKSAEGSRSVDCYELDPAWLVAGRNTLSILGYSLGAGSMTYCPSESGLRYDLSVGTTRVVSDRRTRVRPCTHYSRETVRLWHLNGVESFDARPNRIAFRPAEEVSRKVRLYPRRVPLPSRDVYPATRIIRTETVAPPNLQLAVRVRQRLVPDEQKLRTNLFVPPAVLVADVLSPVAQDIDVFPTLGAAHWHLNGRQALYGIAWSFSREAPTRLRLKQGPNRLVAIHQNNHFDFVNFCARTRVPVTVRNPFGQGRVALCRVEHPPASKDMKLESPDWDTLRKGMVPAGELDEFLNGNPYDRVRCSQVVSQRPGADCGTPADFTLAPERKGLENRIVLDTGAVRLGWIAFDICGEPGAEVLFALSEHIEDKPDGRIQWPNGANNGFRYICGSESDHFETFHPQGVRYILVQSKAGKPVRIRNLRVVSADCQSRNKGSFLCDDPLLNDIYDICVQTNISGVNDTFTDCPTFEQVNWNSDNRTAMMAEALSCANYPVERNSILLFAEDPRHKDMVLSHYPSTWDNWIPLWSMHWMLMCEDYYDLTADTAFLTQVFPRIRKGIEAMLAKIDDSGLFALPDERGDKTIWHFVEWGHGRDDDHAVNTAENAGLVAALACAGRIARIVAPKDTALSRRWSGARRGLVKAISRKLWDGKRGLFADSLHENGTVSPASSQTTNALVCMFGAADTRQRASILKRLLQPSADFLPFGSPYGLFYILEFFAQERLWDEIYTRVRDRWGAMVLDGDKTVWETFAEFGQGSWPTRSRCHPGLSYVGKYLVEGVLGVKCLAPGWKRFSVTPRPPAGMRFARGSVPTPQGLICVEWNRTRDGKLDLRVQNPRECMRVK